MKKYRITENKLRNIIKEAVIDFINEERYSHDDAKKIHDYDPNFQFVQNIEFKDGKPQSYFEPYNGMEYTDDNYLAMNPSTSAEYWDSLRQYDNRHNISDKEKSKQVDNAWREHDNRRYTLQGKGGGQWHDFLPDENQNVIDRKGEFAMRSLKDDDKNAKKIRGTYRDAKKAGHPHLNWIDKV